MQQEKQEAKKNSAVTEPKPAKGVKPAPGAGKPKKKVSAGAMLAILLVVLIIGAVALVYLNVGGLRQKLADALQTEPVTAEGETAAVDAAELEKMQSELEVLSADLNDQSAKLKEKTKELKDKEQLLNERETALKAREEAVAGVEDSITRDQQAQEDLLATAKIFEQMEAAVAATAISGLSAVEDMVALLRVMPSDKAAAILGHMEAKLATRVLSEMMK